MRQRRRREQPGAVLPRGKGRGASREEHHQHARAVGAVDTTVLHAVDADARCDGRVREQVQRPDHARGGLRCPREPPEHRREHEHADSTSREERAQRPFVCDARHEQVEQPCRQPHAETENHCPTQTTHVRRVAESQEDPLPLAREADGGGVELRRQQLRARIDRARRLGFSVRRLRSDAGLRRSGAQRVARVHGRGPLS